MTLSLTRRSALVGMAAVPLAAGVTPAFAEAPAIPSPSLNALAARKHRRFGSSINAGRGAGIGNPDYTAIVAGECGLIVPENELKWQATRPAPDKFDFTRMDAIVAWAQTHKLGVRGHTLLWHRPKWFPKWLNDYDFGANPAREAERLLTTHIKTVTDRYRGVIHSYDVVNEAIDHDTHGTLATSLSRAMGSPEAVIDLAHSLGGPTAIFEGRAPELEETMDALTSIARERLPEPRPMLIGYTIRLGITPS